jgi:CBS domain-containing protein
MTTAREIMTAEPAFLDPSLTATEAAERLAREGVGAMPVCGDDGRLAGVVTDRDLVVKVLAKGQDPSATSLSQLADQPEVVTIGADDPIEEAVRTMKEHQVRRVPVIDGDRVVGMLAQADIARNCPPELVADLVAGISD